MSWSSNFLRKGRATVALVLAACIVVAAFAPIARAQTTANWTSETSGDWADASLWSTNPNYPDNGIPLGVNYDAVINATGGTPYAVSLDGDITVNSLSLNSTDATVNHTSGTLTFTTATLSAGTYNLSGGTLANGTLDLAGGTFNLNSGKLDNVSVTGGDLQLNSGGTLFVRNGISIANTNLDLGGGSYLYFDGPSQAVDNLNITPNGGYAEIYASGPTSGGPQTLTLGSNVTVHGGALFYNYNLGDTLINNGTLNADTGTYIIYIALDNFTNNNIAQATNGGQLHIVSANWINNGTISASNSSALFLGGTTTGANFGNVTTDATSVAYLNGTINGGTINVGGGNIFAYNATLNGVSVTGGDLWVDGSLFVQNGISIANTNLDLYTGSYLYFDGSPGQSVNNLNITPSTYAYINTSGPTSGGPQTLTLGNNVTVHGGAQFNNYNSGDTLINNGAIDADNNGYGTFIILDNFTNNGTVQATGGNTLYIGAVNQNFTNNGIAQATGSSTLYINSANWNNAASGTISVNGSILDLGGSWSNAGAITATNASVVNMGGNFTTAGIGSLSVSPDSTLYLTGNVNNTGAILSPGSYGGTWYLALNGSIANGQLDVSAGNFAVLYGILNNVSVTGGDLQVTPGGQLYVQNGITIANTNLDLGANSYLYFDGPSQAVDNLNITPGGYSYIYPSGPTSGGPQTLTLGSNVTVHGGAQFYNNYTGDTLINNGAINADNAYPIRIATSNFTNNATAQATNGDTLAISAANWANNGILSATGGSTLNLGGAFTTAQMGTVTVDASSSVYISGAVNNSSAIFSPTGGMWYLSSGGSIAGGTIDQSVAPLYITYGTLNGVNVTGGDLQVNPGGQLFVQNGITIANTNLDLGNSASLYFDGSPGQSVNNLNITPSSYGYINTSGPTSGGPQTLTLGNNVTVHGGAQFNNYNAGDSLINNGAINADSSIYGTGIYLDNFTNNNIAQAINGGTLTINSTNWNNAASGTISANGSTLNLGGSWNNAGVITAINASTVNLGGSFTTAGIGSLSASADSILNITGSLDNSSAVLTPNNYGGTWYLSSGGRITNGTLNTTGGTFSVQNGILNNVNVTGADLQVNGQLYVQNGITIANTNLDLGNSSSLYFDGSPGQSVNNLNITSSSYGYINTSGPNSGGPQTLTLGNNVTVHGGAQFNNYNAGDSLINNGAINADSSIYGTGIYLDNFTNNNIAQATNGDSLYINSANWINNGTISATTNGTVYLGGTVPGANVGLLTTDATGAILLNGTINGGTVNVGGGNIFAYGATLNGVSINGGDLRVANNGSLIVQNGITIANTNLDLGSGSNLYFDGPGQSVDNLNITPSPTGVANIYVSGPTSVGPQTLTLGSNVTVHGGANLGNYNVGDALINNGTINGDSSTVSSNITASTFTNNNLVEATNGGTQSVNSPYWTNNGTISATTNGTVYLGGTVPGANIGLLSTDATGQILLNGTINGGTVNVGGGNILARGTLNAVSINGGDLQVSGTLTVQNGITIANTNLDLGGGNVLLFDGPSQAVDNLNITPSTYAYIYPSGPTSGGPQTLTLGSNVTVHGGAIIQNYISGDTLINNGTINADSSSYNTSVSTSNFTNNNGTVEATNGGTLAINSPSFTNNGTIALHNGTITVPYGLNVGDGTLTGLGTINATVTLSSDPSTLAFQLRSFADYDSLTINGSIALAGNLQVTLANGFTPSYSDVYTLLQADSLSGSFLNVANGGILETTDASGYFTVNYGVGPYLDEIVLTDFSSSPVPEPASLFVLILGAGAGLLLRRQRRGTAAQVNI